MTVNWEHEPLWFIKERIRQEGRLTLLNFNAIAERIVADAINVRWYKYVDYKKKRALIFQCLAHNILEADGLFEASTGINPSKTSTVGCEVPAGPVAYNYRYQELER